MDKFKDLAPFLVVVALAAGGAAAAIILPTAARIEASVKNGDDKLDEKIQKLSEVVDSNRSRNILLEYMVTHSLNHGMDGAHSIVATPSAQDGDETQTGG